MDLTSLYYFQELSKDLNMTKAAERLYISQQTLSNHIQRLEQYYGTKLFYRKPSLSLTCAGEFVLSFAQVVGKEERNLKEARGTQFLPRILPDFHQMYPRVEVRFVEGLSQGLERQTSNGELDFALVLSDRYSPDLVEHEFLQDHIYLCVPENLLRAYYTPEEVRERKIQAVQGVELRDFDRLPFALMTNRLGARIQEIFTREHIQPNVFFTAPSTAQTLPMCTKGLAACYCTHMNLVEKRGTVDANVNIFPLYDQGVPLVQKLSLLRHKQRYLTHFAKYFMDLTFQVAASIEKTPVRWIVQQPAVEKSVENV